MRQPDTREAAVVADPHGDPTGPIAVFVSCTGEQRLCVIALKSLAAKALPPYMIPGRFEVLEALPRTSTNKIDYQLLKSAT